MYDQDYFSTRGQLPMILCMTLLIPTYMFKCTMCTRVKDSVKVLETSLLH